MKKRIHKSKKAVSKKSPVKHHKKINKFKKKHITHIKKHKLGKIIRVSSGIKNFDKLAGGGFEKNSTNVIVGPTGSGKSVFCTQFLIEGLRKGEKCIYVTFEEKKQQFYQNMAEFGWNLEAYEKKGQFYFLEYTPSKVRTMLEEGGGEIETIVVENKVSRLVIDSMTSFALLFYTELEKREAALSLFNMIKNWNCTSVLSLEANPITGAMEKETKTIEFESDSIVQIYFYRNKGERKRYIEILKMRGTHHSSKIYSFDIGKSGIQLYSKPIKKPAI